MQFYRLSWANNTSWRWTRDFSAFATLLDAGAVVRMTVAFVGGAYTFASDDSGDGAIEIVVVDGKRIGIFKGGLADLRAKKGFALVDCRITMLDGSTGPMFTGSLAVRAGVTTAAADAAATHAEGIPDTVVVVGETDPTPVPMPAGLTAVLAACLAAQQAAEAAVAGLYSNAQIDAKDAAILASANSYTDAAVGAISLDWGSITALQNLALIGIGAVADATNPLSAKLNAALFTAKSTGEGGTGDLRFTLNKSAAGNTVSQLYETNWSGRAETGLTGDDHFHVKVSADGSTWKEAINIDPATGLVNFSQGGLAKPFFFKADSSSPAFAATGAGSLNIKAGTMIWVAGALISLAADTAVTMPTLAAGTDYAIYACSDGSIRADASFTAPSGYSSANSRLIGGFHYAPGGNAPAQAGGNTTPAINPYSIWDLKWRPKALDPRGMTLVANAFWCDIYLLGVDHQVNGTSKFNVQIADSGSPPKVPALFGGNGSTLYSTLTWYQASEIMQAYGKDLLSVGEFASAAYGTTEASSTGSDPVTTALNAAFTSKWGVMLSTGAMWVWGRDYSTRWDGTGGWAWQNVTEGRGQLYLGGNTNLVAALLGGAWLGGSDAGSRASNWSASPWGSYVSFGARGRCDHLILV